ncbi:hypothetical protein ACTXT7_010985 [Hymenolepis weldensis]
MRRNREDANNKVMINRYILVHNVHFISYVLENAEKSDYNFRRRFTSIVCRSMMAKCRSLSPSGQSPDKDIKMVHESPGFALCIHKFAIQSISKEHKTSACPKRSVYVTFAV